MNWPRPDDVEQVAAIYLLDGERKAIDWAQVIVAAYVSNLRARGVHLHMSNSLVRDLVDAAKKSTKKGKR